MSYITLELDKPLPTHQPRLPFPHQQQAFKALSKTFDFAPGHKARGGLLVLPTGAGKTYTAVNWICHNVLNRKIKVLWLAHSFYLLDQAFATFQEEAPNIPGRQSLNIRVVSSDLSHCRPHTIQPTDDVLIVTTQTAIKNLHTEAVDSRNQPVTTSFRHFIDQARQTGLFVVLDEAHHAPAYGCRNLLIGDSSTAPGLRSLIPDLYLLGLTATPTYQDELRRGWLGKIFEQGIIYQIRQSELMVQQILARPNYIQKPTGREFEVDDNLYDQLVRQHRDIPEYLIEKLANDAQRNDYIVNEYVQNKERYGKTIIFADRWFQCVYLITKLREKGVRAEAVYSHIDADPGSAAARNQRTSTENGQIMEKFKRGKDKSGREEIEVLINVRMLTEGTDVPSVRTVFITRQTTSSILMTQMIGRALRGPKAGGESDANIVLFTDNWKRLLSDVWPPPPGDVTGELAADKPVVRGHYPLEYIAIKQIELLSRHINTGEIPAMPFTYYLPVGWYQTEITVAPDGEEGAEMQTFHEFVMVYEHTRAKFERFTVAMQSQIDGPGGEEWAKEYLPVQWLEEQAQGWLKEYFDEAEDSLGNPLDQYLIRLARHYAQHHLLAPYYSFEERENYDIDRLAEQHARRNIFEQSEILGAEFDRPGNLWKVFYKSFDRFQLAFQAALIGVYKRQQGIIPTARDQKQSQGQPGSIVGGSRPTIERTPREPSPELAAQVKQRDNFSCQACGASGKGVRLVMDHIFPYSLGGETTVENLQTLCRYCNSLKDINEIKFCTTRTGLGSPKAWQVIPPNRDEEEERSVRRLINFFYKCKAVCRFDHHVKRTGRYYTSWQIELYQGNNPAWLIEHKAELLNYIHHTLGHTHVTDVVIRGQS